MFRKIIDFVKSKFARKDDNLSLQVSPESYKNIHHLALLIDGHRRWARGKGFHISEGYRKILEVLPPLLKDGWRNGIHTITVWLLTSDNVVKRPADQLEIIYEVYSELLDVMLGVAKSMQVKMVHIGRKDRMPKFFMDKIALVEKATEQFEGHIFNLALDYGGRDEILHAMKKLIEVEGNISPELLTTQALDKFMYTAGQKYPQPDLIIRPGDAIRLSGFMSWNTGFSEFYFSKKLFPDFTLNDLRDAVLQFNQKERRFGG